MKVRFIFHKGKDSWIGKGIVVWTWILAFVSFKWSRLKDNYSHCEIHFPDGNGDFDYWVELGLLPRGYIFSGQCFSSTTRGAAEGVRFAPASEVLHHAERWRYIEVEVKDSDVEYTKQQIRVFLGEKYDYWGIVGFFWPWNVHAKKKWYCSEICSFIAYGLLRIIDKPYKRISPRRLARVLADKYGEPKELV